MTFPLIKVSGPPRQRGEMYGAAAEAQIRRSVEFYAGEVLPESGMTWGEVCDGVMALLPVWQAEEPDMIAEIEGIAAGAGLETGDVLALNTRGAFVKVSSKSGVGAVVDPDEGCTSFAVLPEASRSGHMLTGQNWDYLSSIRDTIVLLHITPDVGPTMLCILEAGQMGRHGANTGGVALHANGLTGRLRDPKGIPSTFWRRRILREGNITDAVIAALKAPRAGSTNLMITHRDGFAIDLETTPHSARWIHPQDGWLIHTNHFLAGIPGPIADTYHPSADSLVRYGRLEQLMRRARLDGITPADLAAMMRDHFADGLGICTHARPDAPPHEAWETVATVITDLTDGVLSVSPGPPCTGAFTSYEISTGNVVGQDLMAAAS